MQINDLIETNNLEECQFVEVLEERSGLEMIKNKIYEVSKTKSHNESYVYDEKGRENFSFSFFKIKMYKTK